MQIWGIKRQTPRAYGTASTGSATIGWRENELHRRHESCEGSSERFAMDAEARRVSFSPAIYKSLISRAMQTENQKQCFERSRSAQIPRTIQDCSKEIPSTCRLLAFLIPAISAGGKAGLAFHVHSFFHSFSAKRRWSIFIPTSTTLAWKHKSGFILLFPFYSCFGADLSDQVDRCRRRQNPLHSAPPSALKSPSCCF